MNTASEKRDVLVMETLGCFSLRYNDVSLTGMSHNTETYFSSLLQLLVHRGANGVSREELEHLLFGEKELKNSAHHLQSVIYSAQNRLKKAGVPSDRPVIMKNGIYYLDPDIPVWEDAREFEKLAEQGFKSSGECQLRFLMEAISIYRGEFLQGGSPITWIAGESWRLRAVFERCVRLAAAFLREEGKYGLLEQLGRYCSSVEPFAEWEELIMEAYVANGDYDRARAFYLEMNDSYLRQQGSVPTGGSTRLLNRLARQIEYPYTYIEEVHGILSREAEAGAGAFECTYPTFEGIYRIIWHIMDRRNEKAYVMLCTIVDSKGAMMTGKPKLNQFSERLGEALRTTLRRGDVISRISKSQYLVLLTNTGADNIRTIEKRINAHFQRGRQRIRIAYSLVNIFEETLDD